MADKHEYRAPTPVPLAVVSPEIAARIDANCAAKATAAYQHCVEVFPEKGGWDGENVFDRLGKIRDRLDIISALAWGEYADPPVSPNDDGSTRTPAGEFAKLACSVMILGDLLGVLE